MKLARGDLRRTCPAVAARKILIKGSSQTMAEDRKPTMTLRRKMALAAFLGLSALMYVSIIYKIINYGP